MRATFNSFWVRRLAIYFCGGGNGYSVSFSLNPQIPRPTLVWLWKLKLASYSTFNSSLNQPPVITIALLGDSGPSGNKSKHTTLKLLNVNVGNAPVVLNPEPSKSTGIRAYPAALVETMPIRPCTGYPGKENRSRPVIMFKTARWPVNLATFVAYSLSTMIKASPRTEEIGELRGEFIAAALLTESSCAAYSSFCLRSFSTLPSSATEVSAEPISPIKSIESPASKIIQNPLFNRSLVLYGRTLPSSHSSPHTPTITATAPTMPTEIQTQDHDSTTCILFLVYAGLNGVVVIGIWVVWARRFFRHYKNNR